MSPESPHQGGNLLRQLSLAMEQPFVLIAAVLIGGGIGWLLDRWLHTAPWLLLLGGLLGFGGGMRELVRRLTTSGDSEGIGRRGHGEQ